MTTDRLREHFRRTSSACPSCGTAGAFVSCPTFASMPLTQQSAVAEIYRVAAERTREQLRPRRPIPAFSLN